MTKWILPFTLFKLTKLQTDYSLFGLWENFKMNEKKRPEIHCFCLLWLKLHCFRFVLLCKRCLDSEILVGFGRITWRRHRRRQLQREPEEATINLRSLSRGGSCSWLWFELEKRNQIWIERKERKVWSNEVDFYLKEPTKVTKEINK